jgi:hypothetical protein
MPASEAEFRPSVYPRRAWARGKVSNGVPSVHDYVTTPSRFKVDNDMLPPDGALVVVTFRILKEPVNEGGLLMCDQVILGARLVLEIILTVAGLRMLTRVNETSLQIAAMSAAALDQIARLSQQAKANEPARS